jgi:hypothetical protein
MVYIKNAFKLRALCLVSVDTQFELSSTVADHNEKYRECMGCQIIVWFLVSNGCTYCTIPVGMLYF